MNDPVGVVLSQRFAKLHHATQLRDFAMYCDQKAVLSRERLSAAGDDFTRFYTDDADQKHGVWNRTFGNLQDFGRLFWFADNNIPNCYGPITLSFDRAIWDSYTDIALTTTNPGDKKYDLQLDRLSDEQVEGCFVKNGKYWKLTKYGLELSVGNDHLPLDLVTSVIVEPINDQILGQVTTKWQSAGLNPGIVKARDTTNSTQNLKDTFTLLVDWATTAASTLPIYTELPSAVPEQLKQWFSGLRYTHYPALRQWLIYTYNGTIRCPAA